MATNSYISWNAPSEQNLHTDLVIETLKIYGQDLHYIPREIIQKDTILNEEQLSKFTDSIEIEMYLENVDGFEGNGELFSKFGFEMRHQIRLVVAKRRFEQEVANSNGYSATLIRPREGDLVYHPMTNGLFEITHVENELPIFYNLENLPIYRLTCDLFEYGGEQLDTGVDDIDDFQSAMTPDQVQIRTDVEFNVGDIATITNVETGITTTAKILQKNSDNDYALGQLSFSDDQFHTIVEGQMIHTDDAIGTVTTVYDTLLDDRFEELPYENEDPAAQNSDFEEFGDSYIDTSRNNPLGSPRTR